MFYLWRCLGAFILSFEQILHIAVVFPLLTLNMYMLAAWLWGWFCFLMLFFFSLIIFWKHMSQSGNVSSTEIFLSEWFWPKLLKLCFAYGYRDVLTGNFIVFHQIIKCFNENMWTAMVQQQPKMSLETQIKHIIEEFFLVSSCGISCPSDIFTAICISFRSYTVRFVNFEGTYKHICLCKIQLVYEIVINGDLIVYNYFLDLISTVQLNLNI